MGKIQYCLRTGTAGKNTWVNPEYRNGPFDRKA